MGLIPRPSAEDSQYDYDEITYKICKYFAATLVLLQSERQLVPDAGSTEPVGPDSELVEIDLNGISLIPEIRRVRLSVRCRGRKAGLSSMRRTGSCRSVSYVLTWIPMAIIPQPDMPRFCGTFRHARQKRRRENLRPSRSIGRSFYLAGGVLQRQTETRRMVSGCSYRCFVFRDTGGVVTLNIDGESDIMLSRLSWRQQDHTNSGLLVEHKLR